MFTNGPIDCDLHPAVPNVEALLPYLSEHWAEVALQRGIPDLDTAAYPANAPISGRPDWRPETGKPGASLDLMRTHVLDHCGTRAGICNVLYGVQVLYSADMAAAFARAVNHWLATEWLDREPRLRGSIVVPVQNIEMAVKEVEHWAADKRFVQVLLPVFADMPLGHRHYWPIYEAAEKHGLPIGIHAGSTYRQPVTSVGWPTYYLEEYVAHAQGFQSQLGSLICEGVFQKFPGLKAVFIESGFTWLPAAAWRLDKFWQGTRSEIPWVDRSPSEITREHIRFTLQPVDAPPEPKQMERFMEHMGSEDLLLFSTDYPHWQYDGDEAMPEGLSDGLVRKIRIDNPLNTYKRLAEDEL